MSVFYLGFSCLYWTHANLIHLPHQHFMPVTLLCMNPYIQNNPLLFDIKLVVGSHRSIKDRQYNGQMTLDKRTNTLQRKLKTDQTELYKQPVRGVHRWKMRTNARTCVQSILTSIKIKVTTMSQEENHGYVGHITFLNRCITQLSR